MSDSILDRQKGPVEILCKEIGFHFERSMERDDILISFVSVLVEWVAEGRETQERIAHLTKAPPSSDSAEVLRDVRELLRLDNRESMLKRSAEIHNFIHEVAPEDAYPCDHLIDMLSSCVSAIRFGLEIPCHSRHAAAAASHVWKQRYGISLFDEYTSAWENDWARHQLQRAITNMIPKKANPHGR